MTSLVNNQQDDFEPDDFTPETDDFVADDFEPDEKPKEELGWLDKNFSQEGRQQQVAKNRNLAKAIPSGISAGFSEMIPGLEVEEGSEGTIGKVVGSLLPLGLATKAIAYPLKAAAHALPKLAKPIHALGNLLGLSTAGGLYEGLEESAHKSIEQGEFVPPDPDTILKEGAKWAALDVGLNALGFTGRFAKALYNKATALEKPVVEVLDQTIKQAGSGDKFAEKALSILEGKPLQQVEKEAAQSVVKSPETNISAEVQQQANYLKTKKVDVKDFSRLEAGMGVQVKPYLPGEFQAERIAEETLTEDLTGRIEEVSQRAATERELGENIKKDLEIQIEAAKKETDALYEVAKKVENTQSPNLSKTAGAILEELKKLKAGDLKLSPEGYAKAEKQLTQAMEDLGYSISQDVTGAIDQAIHVKPISLAQSIEIKKRLNKIINYDLLETSAQDFLKGPTAVLREDIRVGYGPKDSPARKAFEKAEKQFGETAEKKGKKSITNMRYSEKPESIAKVVKTPSGLADVKDIVSKEQFSQIERELLEHIRGLNEERAAAYYREIRPSLSDNTRTVAEEIIASKAPAASPTRKVAQRNKIQEMVFDDLSKATITGERPEKVLDLWKTKEGQQLIKNALENNPNKKEVLKYIEDQSFADFHASVISPNGEINFKKLNEYLKDPATAENIRLVAGEDGLNFLKNLETLTNRIEKNKSILEGRIDKGSAKERDAIRKEIDKKGNQRFKKAKEKREALSKEEQLAAEAKEKSTLLYKMDDYFTRFGYKTKGALTTLGLLSVGPAETLATVAAYEVFKSIAKNPSVRTAFKKAAIPHKSSIAILRSFNDINKAFEED